MREETIGSPKTTETQGAHCELNKGGEDDDRPLKILHCPRDVTAFPPTEAGADMEGAVKETTVDGADDEGCAYEVEHQQRE